MKKITLLLITFFCIVLLAACGGGSSSANALSSKHVTIDGVYVNDSFVDDDNPSLKLVYVFYDVHTDDTNLKISSVSDLKSSSNTYTFEGLVNNKAGQNYMSSYHYGRTLVDIYSGESAKFLSTFKVPENDIPGDGSLHIVNADIPDMETIEIKSDNIKHCNSYEEIAEAADPEGYSKEVELQQEADAETTAKVQNGINGYKWDFLTNNTTMAIEFFEPNQFTLSLLGAETGSGSYTVKNGYVSVKYDSNGEVVDIPWYEKDGEIEIKPQDAYAIP